MTEPRFNEVVGSDMKKKGMFTLILVGSIAGEIAMAWLGGGWDPELMMPIPLAFSLIVTVLTFGRFRSTVVQVDDRQLSMRRGKVEKVYPLGWIKAARPCQYRLALRRGGSSVWYWIDGVQKVGANLVLGVTGDILGSKDAVLLDFHDGRTPVIIYARRRDELLSAIEQGMEALPEDVRYSQRLLLKGVAVPARLTAKPMAVSGAVFIVAAVGLILASGADRALLAPLLISAAWGIALVALAKPVGESEYPAIGKVLLLASWLCFVILALATIAHIVWKYQH